MDTTRLRLIDRSSLDAGRLLDIYEMSFPQNERIESDVYYDLLEEYGVDCYGIYANDRLVGLFNVMPKPQYGIVYLWYLAVEPASRGKGIGGKALDTIIKKYEDCQVVLDMEPLSEESGNFQERKARERLYLRHGFTRSGRGMRYFGNSFEIMTTKPPFREEDFRRMFREPGFRQWHPEFFDMAF